MSKCTMTTTTGSFPSTPLNTFQPKDVKSLPKVLNHGNTMQKKPRRLVNFKKKSQPDTLNNSNASNNTTIFSTQVKNLNFSTISCEDDLEDTSELYPIVKRKFRKGAQQSNSRDTTPGKTSTQRRLLSGPKLLENSKFILKNIKTPKEIFQETIEQKSQKTDSCSGNTYGKERIKNLAKRFHILIDLHEEGTYSQRLIMIKFTLGEIQKTFDFMKKVPLQYYQKFYGNKKLRKNTQADTAQRQRNQTQQNNTKTKDSQVHSLQNSTLIFHGEYLRSNKHSPCEIDQRTRSKSEYTSTKQSKHEDRPQIKFPLISSNSRTLSNWREVVKKKDNSMDKNQNQKVSPKQKDKRKEEANLWISQTTKIRKRLDSLETENSTDLADLHIEQAEKVYKTLQTLAADKNQTMEESGSLVLSDASLEVFTEMESKHGESHNIQIKMSRKRDLAAGKKGNHDNLHFYKHLIFKEQKAVERTIMHVTNPKPKVLALFGGGRNLFDFSNIK